MEELLQEEKREQERQASTVGTSELTNSNLLSDHDFERLRADVFSSTPQGLPAQGLLPLQQKAVDVQLGQHANIRQKFLGRGTNQNQWRPTMSLHTQLNNTNQSLNMSSNNNTDPLMVRKEGYTYFKQFFSCIIMFFIYSILLYNANLQPAPPLPPDNVVTDHDRQLHLAYEQWLQNQYTVLLNQQEYYETEILKLRKNRKSLNSKQRVLRKSGNELTTQDAKELSKITSQQTIVQKQFENSKKQARQHGLLMQVN